MAFGLFKKKKEKKDERFMNLRIREVVPIAKDAVNLVFDKPSDFSYEPGQFITIISEVDGKKIRRAYSLCTTPFEDDLPAVTVKRVPGGAMSNFLNDKAEVDQEIEIMEPMGMFTTQYDSTQKRNVMMFGGGSGITPLISIIRSILIKEPDSDVTLVYANRSEEYIIFKDLLHDLDAQHSNFHLYHILENGNANFAGRLTDEIISQVAQERSCNDDTEFYICGPQPMMDIAFVGIERAGFKQKQIRMESFEAGKTSPGSIVADEDATVSEVTILLDGEEHLVEVRKGESILDTALDAGLDMPYSCQSGLCTACRGNCLEGEVSTDEAEGLSGEELEEGYVLTCVGKPVSDKIKIEMG